MSLALDQRVGPISGPELLAFIAADDRTRTCSSGDPVRSQLMDRRGPDADGVVTILTGLVCDGEPRLELGGVVRLADGALADFEHAIRDRSGTWQLATD